jgi:hypothetical protein
MGMADFGGVGVQWAILCVSLVVVLGFLVFPFVHPPLE